MTRPAITAGAIVLAALIVALGMRYEYVGIGNGEMIIRGDRWGLTPPCIAWVVYDTFPPEDKIEGLDRRLKPFRCK